METVLNCIGTILAGLMIIQFISLIFLVTIIVNIVWPDLKSIIDD